MLTKIKNFTLTLRCHIWFKYIFTTKEGNNNTHKKKIKRESITKLGLVMDDVIIHLSGDIYFDVQNMEAVKIELLPKTSEETE